MSDITINGGDFTFEPTILKEMKAVMLDEEYTLPAIDHPHLDALTSLFAVVIKLHKRVEALEAELRSRKGGETRVVRHDRIDI
jgi:hypothetical protein